MLKKKTLLTITSLSLVFSPLVLFAQEYVPLAPLPGIAGDNDGSFAYFLQNSFYLLIGIAGVLAVIMIMIGGIQYMTTDAISGKEEGKERITKALLGLFLAIGAWLILSTINPDILDLNLSIKQVDPPSTSDDFFPNTYTGAFIQYESSENKCLKDQEINRAAGFGGRYDTLEECKEYLRLKYNSSSYPYETGPDKCQVWSCIESGK